MAEHIWDVVKKQMIEMIRFVRFIAVIADETTTNDNSSWIVVHVYIMQNWRRMSLLCSLQRMFSTDAIADILIQTLVDALRSNWGLEVPDLEGKLLCIGVDGASAFQGHKIGVVKQISEKYALFVLEVHCCVHKQNPFLALECCMPLKMSCRPAIVILPTPKKVAEFHTLVQLMEAKGLKLLKNVKTCWIIALLRRLI